MPILPTSPFAGAPGARAAMAGRSARVLLPVAVAVLYALAGCALQAGEPGPAFQRIVWLPSGIGLWAVLAGGPRLAWAAAGGAVALGTSVGMGPGSALAMGFAAATESLAGLAALRRAGFERRFTRLRETLLFAAVAFGVALPGGTLEFFAMLPHVGAGERHTAWWICWLGHALGILLVVPVAPAGATAAVHDMRAARPMELASLFAATAGLSLAVFTAMGDPHMFNPMSYVLFPLLLWGVLRFGPREVAALLLLTALVAIWGTASGNGPFALAGREASLGSLYLYLSVAALGALALSASIAERAGVVEALAASERQYRELVETMNEGVIAFGRDGRIRFANGSFARMAGASAESVVGRDVGSLLGEGPWAAGAASASPSGVGTLLHAADGRSVEVSVSPREIRDEAGAATGWLAVVADRSEHRRTDDMLRWIARATAPLTGEAFFREMMRHMASAFGFRHAFITECVNDPSTRLRTLACWSGSGFAPEREYDLAGTPCEETIRGRRVYRVEDGVEERHAAERGLGVRGYLGVPIMDTAGERVIGHVAFLTEGPMDESVLASPLFQILTSRAGAELRRKRAEEQGRQHLQQLAQVSRALALGEMGSAIAHELNQPLAAITNYAHASRRRLEAGEAGEEVRSALERIAAQAERAGEILRRLRGFLADGGAAAAPADPGALVAEIIDLALPEARERGVALQVDLARDLPAVRVDGIQVQQVVLNLVRNAVEATAGLATGPRSVQVAARAARGGVEVTVTDTGHGVAAELAERIFEPFFTTKSGGTGIGLAISRSIAEAHGGRLRVETPPRGGACFALWLPGADADG